MPRPRWRRRALLVVQIWLVVALRGSPAEAQLRPLVREMLENLAALNQIGEGVALDDYEKVGRAAAALEERARVLQDVDISTLGLAAERDAQFDAYLAAQRESARAIGEAARQKDGGTVMLAMQQLAGNACLACHRDFREPANALRPSVLFMTTLLNSWADINRGVMVNDFDLVARGSREIQSVVRVFTWDQVIESTFGLSEAEQRKAFRELLRNLTSQAARVEKAALEEQPEVVIEASRRMWTEGCLQCHERFRKAL